MKFNVRCPAARLSPLPPQTTRSALRILSRMKIQTTAVCALGVSLLTATLAQAQKASLLVLSKKDHTLSIIDAATLEVVAKVPVGNDPHEVVASDDGRTAWVSNYGFGAFHTLAVVDLQNAKALPQIDLDR